MIRALRSHWPEYLMEAVELGIFMISAAGFTALFEYPGSPVHQMMPDPFLRRMLIGIAMGLTAVGLIFSPLGKRSGAHMNPAVTLAFMRLGKVAPRDALFYIVSQFVGGVAGVFVTVLSIRGAIADPSVNYVVTVPGPGGEWIAFAAEFIISFLLMLTVLVVSNTPRLSRWTGVFCGCLIAVYVTFEAPLSGMSMNPARTFGSATVAMLWTSWWIYFTAPVLAMLLAAEIYTRSNRVVYCAKLHHHNGARCIFNCSFGEMESASSVDPGP